MAALLLEDVLPKKELQELKDAHINVERRIHSLTLAHFLDIGLVLNKDPERTEKFEITMWMIKTIFHLVEKYPKYKISDKVTIEGYIFNGHH
jgi:hypothetical protein